MEILIGQPLRECPFGAGGMVGLSCLLEAWAAERGRLTLVPPEDEVARYMDRMDFFDLFDGLISPTRSLSHLGGRGRHPASLCEIRRVEEVRRLAQEESGEGRSVWISMNWDLRMGVKEALQQQRALTELVEGSELVVKTTVLEADLDEWPGADQRRAQVMHSGTMWLAREGLALSRVSPALEL